MSQSSLKARNVGPILQAVRNFLLGRKHTPERAALRYAPLVSARTQPQPILPDGEAHKMSANHYVLRDGRREAAPPIVVVDNSQKNLLTPGAAGDKKVATTSKAPPTPGKYWEWD